MTSLYPDSSEIFNSVEEKETIKETKGVVKKLECLKRSSKF